MHKPKALFILSEDSFRLIYSQQTRRDIASVVDLLHSGAIAREAVPRYQELLREAEVIFSGWDGPLMDADFLSQAPSLKAVFYGAGSVKYMLSQEFWERGCRITSAYAMNAIPVSEFTVAQIILSLKHFWHMSRRMHADRGNAGRYAPPGAYKKTVGIVSFGLIGRKVCELLQSYDLNVIAYDPCINRNDAATIGAKLVTLEEVFCESDVVTLHAPWLNETVGMVTGKHFERMKRGATFINTARGAIVNEREMIHVLQKRSDLFALLDVTWPEPPERQSPLYDLANVVLTPHIAGSLGDECVRMGDLMLEEVKRYVNREPLLWELTQERTAVMA